MKPWNFRAKNWCIIPIVLKIIHQIETPHSVAFNYDGLVCRFIKSTAGAIFSILCILAHTFYTYISSYKFCPLKLFFYCEYMLQDLTYAFCVNRPFTRIRMNFIASAHNTCHFFILKRVYGISRLLYLIFATKKL